MGALKKPTNTQRKTEKAAEYFNGVLSELKNMEEKIFRVLVPMEDEIEFKNGKQKITKRKVYPGYVLVEMEMTDDSWYVVRNTPGVTGFVGTGTKPIPL